MSDEPSRLFSNQWHRVAHLTPRLRPHVKIERHNFGGQTWYMVLDPAKGTSHRLSPAVHHVVSGMDGNHTLEALWLRAHERLGDEAPTQDDCLQILGQLHGADILLCQVPPDFREIVTRGRSQRRNQLFARFKNPLGIRIPLIDPDRFLERTVKFVAPLISPAGFLFWLVFVAYGVVLAAMHYQALTADFADRVLAADNLFMLWLTFPFVKLLHELGHGYAVKRWGGEVHEIGVMFLVFVPIPYVDAGGAYAFREKWKRAFVGAAGIMTELPIAVIALMIWIEAEPGLVRAIAYNTILITGVSTLLFNGNPLLRYDGYYVLADIAEMPNLATRANKYVTYLIQRRLFGAKRTTNPVDQPSERWKLFTYAVLAFAYRMVVWVGIILIVASKFFIIGAVLAAWAVWLMAGWPLVKAVRYLASSPSLSGRRRHAIAITGGVVGALALIFFIIPAPLATVVEGVVWTPEKSEIRARRSGIVQHVSKRSQDAVVPGDEILTIEDPIAQAEVQVAEWRKREIDAKFRTALSTSPHTTNMIRPEREEAANRIEYAKKKFDELSVYAGATGRLIMTGTDDLPGKYVQRGDLIGYVKGNDGLVVRAVIPEKEIALVRARAKRAEIRLATNAGSTHKASIQRIEPASARQLPNLALSKEGGGRYSLDPTAQVPGQTLDAFYNIELVSESINSEPRIGARAYVRIDLGYEPLGAQIYRRARQVFLERLNV